MIHVVHPTGNVFVRALLGALLSRGEDYHFYTTLGLAGMPRWAQLLPRGLRGELERRSYSISKQRLSASYRLEVGRLLASQLNLAFLTAHEAGHYSLDQVYRGLDRQVASSFRRKGLSKDDVIYGYEDGCLDIFDAGHASGARCVYDLPIAYCDTSRTLLQEEAERLPDWEPTLVGTRDSLEKLERKRQELKAADAVVCPSRFVYRSLPEKIRAEKRCAVAEFGSPRLASAIIPRSSGKLRVLFAGSMTQRKGLADVFTAMNLLKSSTVELTVMGSAIAPIEFYRSQFYGFRYERTRPHADVLALMQQHDVLVLPSIVEGRALVQQEAMSCGLPIIVTANAGGEDLVVEGITGFLVPIRDPECIAEKIAWCSRNRRAVAEMGRAARARAMLYTWDRYTDRILSVVHGDEGASASVDPGLPAFSFN